LRLASIVPALVLAAGAHAQSTVYKCVDKEGRVEFTDISKAGCKAIDVGGAISTPPPAPRTPAVSMRQGAARPAASAAASPVNFPRVDSAAQRARDDDRRAILDEELRAEEKKLVDLRRDAGNAEPERKARMRDDIGRAEKNIEALRREIANIR
jgi:hypothetical protein